MIWPCGDCVYAERAVDKEPCASCCCTGGDATNFIGKEDADTETEKG